jgi:hypothetical protein
VYIVFDQIDGEEEEYENLRRIYKIPESGVLFTKFSNKGGILIQDFYFVNKDGSRQKIGTLDVRDFKENNGSNNSIEFLSDSLAIFNPETNGVTVVSDDYIPFYYKAFTVGRYKEINLNRFNYLDKEFIIKVKNEQKSNKNL